MRVHADSVLVVYHSSDSYFDAIYLSFGTKGDDYHLVTPEGTMIGKVRIGNKKIDFKKDPIFGGNYFRSPFIIDCAYLLINDITHYNVHDSVLVLTGDNNKIINLKIKKW